MTRFSKKNWTVNILCLVANCDFYFRLYCYFPVHCTIVLHCCDFSWSSCFCVFLHYQLVDVSVFVVSKGKPVQTEGRKNIWLGHLNPTKLWYVRLPLEYSDGNFIIQTHDYIYYPIFQRSKASPWRPQKPTHQQVDNVRKH